jgi:RNA polymerase sigma factor (sigma-70 family)
MLTAITAVETSSLPSVAGAGAQGVTEASLERRREFDRILSQSLPSFRRIAMRWLRNHEDAEDAVQDAMLSAFRHIAQFDGRAQMSTWLTAIVINAVRMQLRRRPRVQMLSLDQAPEEGQLATAELLVDPKPTPEQNLEQSELRELVIKLTGTLPPSQRAALRLRQKNDFTIKEVAEEHGMPEGTLKAQLARGRAKLTLLFHSATGKPKTQNLGSGSKVRRKGASSGYRGERTQGVAHLRIAVLRQQGGCENWMGA